MGVLDKVEMIEGDGRRRAYDPVRVRRRKLADGLADQLGLIEAQAEGRTFVKVKSKRIRDLETDQIEPVEERRQVAQWWWIDDDGQVQFALRYGSAKLKIKDGKDTMVFADLTALRKLLPPLRQEVLAGAFDAQLAEAAQALLTRFGKAKSKV